MRSIRQTALLIALTLFASQATHATTLLQGYADLPDWQSAATSSGEDTFDSLTPTTFYNTSQGYQDPLGIDFVGAFDSGTSYLLEAVGPSISQYFNFGSGNSLDSGFSSSTRQPILDLNLPANTTAVALDVMTYGNVYPVTITAGDATTEATITVDTAFKQQTFYGFTFSAPISWLQVAVPGSPSSTAVLVDNVEIGTADITSAPEPATFLLIGLGLVFMACLRKRRPA